MVEARVHLCIQHMSTDKGVAQCSLKIALIQPLSSLHILVSYRIFDNTELTAMFPSCYGSTKRKMGKLFRIPDIILHLFRRNTFGKGMNPLPQVID